MDPEANPETIAQEPKSFKSSAYWTLGALICFLIFAVFFAPIVISSPKNSAQTQAISNANQIGLALFQFDFEYGAYPNETTIDLVTKSHPKHGHSLTGKSSNAAFRQLIAAKIVENEDMFHAEINNAKKPDGNISPRQALKKGEVGFAYISGLSTAGNPSRIVILAPMIPGTKKFDPEPFDGRAIVLRIDNSVGTYSINEDGNIYDKGINILSPEHPIWGGKAPDIRYPE